MGNVYIVMNKNLLVIIFLAAAVIFQSCQKDTVSATVTNPNVRIQALIDGTTWTPTDTVSTIVNYNAASKTKTLFCTGTVAQKQINMSVIIKNNSNTPGFNLGTYTVDTTSNVSLKLFLQQNVNGNYVFVQRGTVGPGNGTVVITAVDSVNKVITGTFNFITRQAHYDSNGNITSVDIDNVTSGIFNKLSYNFTSN